MTKSHEKKHYFSRKAAADKLIDYKHCNIVCVVPQTITDIIIIIINILLLKTLTTTRTK